MAGRCKIFKVLLLSLAMLHAVSSQRSFEDITRNFCLEIAGVGNFSCPDVDVEVGNCLGLSQLCDGVDDCVSTSSIFDGADEGVADILNQLECE